MRTWPAIDVEPLTEPDLLQAALVDFDVAAIDERSGDAWRVFFHTSAGRDRAADVLPQGFPSSTFTRIDVADENWAVRSQASLRAVRVGAILVAPPWGVPDAAGDQAENLSSIAIVIVIEPSMGFGTGHHATTRLCLNALQQIDLKGRSVMDAGTGSGVLAIAASRLGASHVVAIDDDADAVQSARDNAVRNGAAVDFRVTDLRSVILPPFDIVVANLTGGLLIQSAAHLTALVGARGTMVVSGVMTHEEAAVLTAFPAFRTVERYQEDEWLCVVLRREEAFA